MARRRSPVLQFNAIQLVGGLLPASLIVQIARQEAPGQKATDYGLKNHRLQVAVDQAWSRAKALWQEAQQLRQRGDDAPWAPWFTRRLLEQVFGWSDLEPCNPRQIEEARFPISHQAFAAAVPLVLTSLPTEELDKGHRQFGQDNRRRSPHSCLQECLNADDDSNWGVLGNGTTLRLLHDNPALVKPAYVQVEIGAILDGGLFDEFAVVWQLLHASRFQRHTTGERNGRCILDGWKEAGQQSGERALNKLRDGVQAALEAVGQGVLQHPANGELVKRLQSGELRTQDFFRQLLRLVYRLLFLCVAEDRGLLFPPGVSPELRQIYRQGYSLSRLRDLAIKSGAHEHQHGDLWLVQKLVFIELSRGGSSLGLPGLGGLFHKNQCPELDKAQLSNAALLEAVRAIGWFYDEQSKSRTRINYQALNAEEFGSVYESLLELHPQIKGAGSGLCFSLGGTTGSERKTTASFYTRESLVQLLLDSALMPVIEERLSEWTPEIDKEKALLAIRVLDPACGSGHFLLGAARKLALVMARLLAGDDEPSEELRRQCLRRVVASCLYGVDKNPMAVELCKVALWVEAMEPGRPLSFLDAHIQCGDSLIGIDSQSQLKDGIPDGAYKALQGDESGICTSLKADNATARRTGSGRTGGVQGQLDFSSGDNPESQAAKLTQILQIPENTLGDLEAKQDAYADWLAAQEQTADAIQCNLLISAYFLRKKTESRDRIPLTSDLVAIELGRAINDSKLAAAIRAAKENRFFHWHLRFPDVFVDGGFDCILGNPPWETMSPDVKEWFATFDPEIRNNSPEGQREIMERLLSDPVIKEAWETHCNQLYSSASFIKSSGRYRLFAPGHLGKGDFNTYRFFVELSLTLCSPKGAAAMIVPENLYNGANAMALRKVLTTERGPLLLRGFENAKNFWFPDIDSRAKFCLYASPPGPRGEHSIDAAFCIRTEQQLKELPSKVSLPSWMAKEIGGEALAIPEIRSSLELAIINKLYAAYPRFKDGYEKLGGPRPYAAELHMGNDRDLFTEDESDIPIFEGKMVDQYDYRAKGYVSGRGRSAIWAELTFGTNSKRIAPQWYLRNKSLGNGIAQRISASRVGFCNVSSPTNQRSLISAIIPRATICGHAVPTVHISGWHQKDMLLFVGIANTLAMDFLARKKVGLNMTFSVMDTLPIPATCANADAELEIVRRAGSLCLVGPEMMTAVKSSAAEDPGWNQLLIEDPASRLNARAEIDAIYAGQILGLTRTEMEFILDPASISPEFEDYQTFSALKRAELRQFNEYRTQRLVLEAWDRLFGA